jgi:hypothetical protein
MMRISLALLAALALLPGSVACTRGRAQTSSFASRAEAGTSVPAWVPATATDLKVQAAEDGAFWLRFSLPERDRAPLEPDLLRIPDEQVATLTFRPPSGVDWWFRGLVQVVPARETTVLAADVFSGAGRSVPQRTFVAFDRSSDRVYAWSAGR